VILEQLNNAFVELVNASSYYRSPSEITVFANQASGSYFRELAEQFQRTSILSSKLTVFYRQYPMVDSGDTTLEGQIIYNIPEAIEDGLVVYDVPLITATYGTTFVTAPPITDNQWNGRLNDPVAPPSEAEPIAKYYGDNQFLILPEPDDQSAYVLTYPTDCNIVYDVNGDYDAGASTDLEWNLDAIVPLLSRMLQYAGLNLESSLISQVAAKFSQTNK